MNPIATACHIGGNGMVPPSSRRSRRRQRSSRRGKVAVAMATAAASRGRLAEPMCARTALHSTLPSTHQRSSAEIARPRSDGQIFR